MVAALVFGLGFLVWIYLDTRPVESPTVTVFPAEKLGTVDSDVAYCSNNAEELMDFYYPSAASASAEEPFPVVLYVHGGGWTSGDKTTLPEYREALTSKGIAVAAVNYRLAPDSVFPAAIEDLKCAVRYLRTNAEVYNIDPDRIGGYGGSAGGHLVALLGTADESAGWDDAMDYPGVSSRLSAVVDMYGPTDLTIEFEWNSAELLKNAFGETYSNAAWVSPISYVTSDDPPFLVMHGEEDALVPISQSEVFVEALQSAGIEVTFVRVEDAGHGFSPATKGVPIETMSDWLVEQLGVSATTTDVSTENIPITISTMTHMEGNFKDDEVEALFNKHVEQLRWAMDLFDEYGAKMTIESEQSFAKANVNWDLNFLKEVVDRGHGVGTHADFGAHEEPALSVEELIQKFKENKALVDALVGAENNRGVSGGQGITDWVLGASGAGFEYMDGVTGFAYLSMPLSARPDSTWTDIYITEVAYHNPIPPEFADRIYPFILKDATDLVPDEDGIMTVLSGDIGELSSLAEGRETCGTKCIFDADDVQSFLDSIEEADAIRDPTRFTRINIHIPAVLFKKENEILLRSLLAGIQTYVDNGTVQWATQGEAYDEFQASL